MLDKINNLSPQVRMILAVVVCLLFFIPYSYYFSPAPQIDTNLTKPLDTMKTVAATPTTPTISHTDSNAPSVPNAQTISASDILTEVKFKDYRLVIDTMGRIAQVYLIGERYRNEQGNEVAILDLNSRARPLELRYSNSEFLKEAFSPANPYRLVSFHQTTEGEPQRVLLQQTLNQTENLVIQKEMIFYSDGHYEIQIQGLKDNVKTTLDSVIFVTPGARPVAENDAFVFKGSIIKERGGSIATFENGDVSDEQQFQATVTASVDRYYSTILYLAGAEQTTSSLNAVVKKDTNGDPLPFISFEGEISLGGYVGPKDYKLLVQIDPLLGDVVEYGIITFFAKPLFLLLEWLYGICGNWGWAIILLTVIVRLVLFPLTYKGMMSMQKFKDIAPKMKEIQQKYKEDPQKMQTQMMELYRKHGANPLGGCLPLLLQMPIFFAIYRVLYNAIELKGAEWILWISDLSVMDPFFVLPLLMGASMFLQQYITPTSFTDPMQEKVFKYLPVIFTIFFITFPSGLVLYWFVSNLFSIVQQFIINKIVEARKKLLHKQEGLDDEKN
ncbi:membrane protein insertase YidC [Helicobacter monodelphidis]|uniref:membrane protein insertase YidC n=1 Tax=Helicobacter sp. 15-1451 TaxID=2004995 RepID=UPI000DCD0377|nr:membrane protein insertase YidC [Helicobacter sp. 15-1451]RAX56949.1 membrane protein insertase YidC [Helicobacter sp. 15-1451]